jgi:hypothetical protein
MRHLQRDIFADHTEPDDDVDRLFNRLEPLEPPADLVVRILNSIAHISSRPSGPEFSWDNDYHEDGLVVRNEKKESS